MGIRDWWHNVTIIEKAGENPRCPGDEDRPPNPPAQKRDNALTCGVCGKPLNDHIGFRAGSDGYTHAVYKLCYPLAFVDLLLGYVSEDEATVARLGIKVW